MFAVDVQFPHRCDEGTAWQDDGGSPGLIGVLCKPRGLWLVNDDGVTWCRVVDEPVYRTDLLPTDSRMSVHIEAVV